MAFIISADEIKKTLPGYDPSHSEMLHSKSTRLADREFTQALKNRAEKTVILMSGGAASGKTEYVSTYLTRRKAIIFDWTMPTIEGAKVKIRNSLRKKKNVEIHAVLPNDLQYAFIAFLNRDRKFPVEHFYRTHSSSRKTLLTIASKFPDIKMEIIISHYIHNGRGTGPSMTFKAPNVDDRGSLIEFLTRNQYTENEIKRIQR